MKLNINMEDTKPIRTFIAVNVTPDIRSRLKETLATLKKSGGDVRWVPLQNMHISLAFIGAIFQNQVDEVKAAMDLAVAGLLPFEIETTGVGTFGRNRNPRVIWAGVKNAEPLSMLYNTLKDLLSVTGIILESRPYTAHLTLGRVKSGKNNRELSDAIEQCSASSFGKMTVENIDLMQSVLSASGIAYEKIYSAKLQ